MKMLLAFLPWLLLATLLASIGRTFLHFNHALLFSQIVGFPVLLVLFGIVLRSITNMAIRPEKIRDELPILLGILGLFVLVLWISQGVFATQVNIKMTAQALPDPQDPQQTLLTVALAIENTGVRQSEIKSASLFACPGTSPTWHELYDPAKQKERDVEHIEYKNMEALGFGGPNFNEFGGDRNPKYFLVWGTQETRQVLFRLPNAAYYDIRFSLGTGEEATNSINKWRASSIVPMMREWHQKDAKEGPLVGKSIEQDRASGETKSTFNFLKKMLGIGS